MRNSTPILLAAVLAASLAVTPARAESCTDSSRACMIAAATSLLEGMWTGDGAKVPLAPNVRKTENGGKNVTEGADAVRKQISAERLAGHKNARFIADEAKHDVFAFWMTAAGTQSGHVAERVRVEHGLITQIEVFWVSDQRAFDAVAPMWPDAFPAVAGSEPCGKSRKCLLAVASTYLDGLVSADGSKVKFAPAIRRTQNGRSNEQGEEKLRAAVARERLAFRRNFRMFADERTGNVVAVWLTGTDTPTLKSTAHVIERLRVEHGLITEIEVFYPLETGVLDGTSGWPDDPA